MSDVTDKLVVTDGNYQKVSDSVWKSGDDLKIPLAGHCLAKISDSLAIIAGGYSFDFQVKSSATIYDGNVISPQNPWRNTGKILFIIRRSIIEFRICRDVEI